MNTPPAQLMQVPLRVGLDESTDPNHVEPGTLKRLKNGVWKKIGRVEKRDGTTHLSSTVLASGAAFTTIQKLLSRNDELLATDSASFYARANAAAAWKRVQNMPALEATWFTAVDTGRNIFAVDCDANATHRVMMWGTGGISGVAALYYQIEDVATGARLVPPTHIANAVTHSRCFIIGSLAVLVYQEGANLKAFTVNLSTLSVGGVSTLRTDAAAQQWDGEKNGSDFTLFYKDTANVLKLYTFNTSLSAILSANVATVANGECLSLAVAPERIYVAYADQATNLVRVAIHNVSTLVQTTGPTTIFTAGSDLGSVVVARRDASNCVVAWSDDKSGFANETSTMLVSSSAVADTNSHRLTRWARIASKPFTLNGRMYLMLATVRTAIAVAGAHFSQNTNFCIEVETTTAVPLAGTLPHKMVAVVAPREATRNFFAYTPPQAPVVGSDAFIPCFYVSGAPTAYAGGILGIASGRLGIRLVKLSTTLNDPWAFTQVGNALALAGGVNSLWDGRRLFELSFLHAPHVEGAVAGTSGAMVAGTYLYVFVYEWRDATGMLHRSIPSPPKSVTVAASGSVQFTIESACTSGRTDVDTGTDNALPVSIIPYRTTVGGTTFYRLAVEPIGRSINDPLSATTPFSDTRADADIDGTGTVLSTRPLLYTTGGILDEVMPPSFTTLAQHRGRLWGVAGDQRTIWYTKKYTEDPGVFPGFHENLRVVLDARIVGLASLDDKLVIFTENAIYALYGDGPAANGQNSDLEGPHLVTGDIACINARSLVTFPGGVIFQSPRGIYLLTRGLEVVWLGKPVRDEVDTYPKCLAAVLVSHKGQVRIAMSDAAETTGIVLTFDYENKIWSTDVYPTSVIRSMLVLDDVVHQTAGSVVAKEDPTTNLDNGAWAELDFELSLTPSGPTAWQHIRRVQILGERQTHHDLRVRFAFDGRAAYSQDFTYLAEYVVTNNDCPTERVGSQNGANPKCRRLDIRVTDGTPTNPGGFPVTTGKGGWFSAIGLELIPKPGLPRHGARHSKV